MHFCNGDELPVRVVYLSPASTIEASLTSRCRMGEGRDMLKMRLPIASLMLIASAIYAQAQTAVLTTTGTVVTNNMQSATITIESSSCGSSATCKNNQSSAVVGGTATGTMQSKDASGPTWVQDWGAYVGTTHYACHFTTAMDSQFTAGQCHAISGSASQKAGPGGLMHPYCQVGTVHQPTMPACTDGSVHFTISQ